MLTTNVIYYPSVITVAWDQLNRHTGFSFKS